MLSFFDFCFLKTWSFFCFLPSPPPFAFCSFSFRPLIWKVTVQVQQSKSSKANQVRNGLIMKGKKKVCLLFYQWIISVTMESKDSISITEALRKQSTFSLKNFHSSNIEPWLLIEIGVAEAQHVDFFSFFCFFLLFSSKNFCSGYSIYSFCLHIL